MCGRLLLLSLRFPSFVFLVELIAVPFFDPEGRNQLISVLLFFQDVGIDLKNAKPQVLNERLAQSADLLVTMGCGEACPYVPGLKREDWAIEDPKGRPLEKVRQIRDEIRNRVETLVKELDIS